MNEEYPILEFDADKQAILNPERGRILRAMGGMEHPLPETGVLCFFGDVISKLIESGTLKRIGHLVSEMGENPIYALDYQDKRMFVMHPGVGAPTAAAFLEELIGIGAQKVIACGGCGVLQKDIAVGHPVLLSAAVRDEGTSYHYIQPSREIGADKEVNAVLEKIFKAHQVDYRLGKTWTTDAIYRETRAKREKRVKEGCIVVEMEASAFMAVAQFRGIRFGQVVYGGDMVVPEGWDGRAWDKRDNIREALFWLAVEAAANL